MYTDLNIASLSNKYKSLPKPLFLISGSVFVGLLLSCNFLYRALIIYCIAMVFSLLLMAIFKCKIKISHLSIFYASGLLSIALFNIYYTVSVTPVQRYVNDTEWITGTICSSPLQNGSRTTLTISGITFDKIDNVKFKSEVSCAGLINAKIGDNVTGKVTFTSINSSVAYSQYMSNGIYIKGYFLLPPQVKTATRRPIAYYINSLSTHCKQVFSSQLPAEEYGTINAMFLGDRSALTGNVKTAFINDGISYIIAIAGMQLTIIVMFLNGFLRSVFRKKWLTYLITLVFIITYVLMIGLPITAVRAGIMLILFLTAERINRRADGLTSLGISVLIICISNPLSVYGIGFLLSVLATFGLIVLYPILYKWCNEFLLAKIKYMFLCKLLRYVLQIFIISICCILFTLPVSILVFGTTAPLSPIISVFIMPFLQLLLYSALIACALSFLPVDFLTNIFVLISGVMAKVIIIISEWFEKIPFSNIITNQNFVFLSISACCILIFVYLLCKLKIDVDKKIKLKVCLMCATIVIASGCSYNAFNANISTVAVLDVSNGLCCVVQSYGLNIMIGCGGDNYPYSQISTYLHSHGVKRIDELILPQNNEMYSAAAVNIIDNYNVMNVWARNDGDNATSVARVMNRVKNSNILSGNFFIKSDNLLINIFDGDVYMCVNGATFAVIQPEHTVNTLLVNINSVVICGNSFPINMQNCAGATTIVSGDSRYGILSLNRLKSIGVTPFVTAGYGPIIASINTHSNIKIWRSHD